MTISKSLFTHIIILAALFFYQVNTANANSVCNFINKHFFANDSSEKESSSQYAQAFFDCIPAEDFGLGGSYYVPANPDEGNTSGGSNLIQTQPESQQIAPWVATSLHTLGREIQDNNSRAVLKVYISGIWAPWDLNVKYETTNEAGDTIEDYRKCQYRKCNNNNPDDGICLSDGIIVDADFSAGKAPCALEKGMGLYGLISLTGADPNDRAYASSLPSNHFRTFHMNRIGEDKDGAYFELTETKFCDENNRCVIDNKDGIRYIPKGQVYLKIMDRYYQDNIGGYNVLFVDGVAGEKGFVQNTIEGIEKTISQVTESIYDGILRSNFIQITRALLVLYITFTGLNFTMGLLKIERHELVNRLFKVGIVVMAISPFSWEFFNEYLFKLFTEGAREIADIVIDITIYRRDRALPFILPENANVLSVMDGLLRLVIAPSVWKKILALLWESSVWFFFFGIIICMFFIILGMVQAMMLYIVAIFVLAFLIMLAPIFIVLILFNVTKRLFDDWIKQLISASLMIILVSTIIAMLVMIVIEGLYNLMHFSVCWDVIWDIGWFGTISGYKLTENIDHILNWSNFLNFLVLCLVFYNVISYIPNLVDALAGAARQPIGQAVQTAQARIQQFTAGKTDALADIAYFLPRKADETLEQYKGYKLIKGVGGFISSIAHTPVNIHGQIARRLNSSGSITGYDPNAPRGKISEGISGLKHSAHGVFGGLFKD